MKKLMTISAIALLAVLVFGVAGYAYAQTQTPTTPTTPSGYGRMGGGGMSRGSAGMGMMGGRGAQAGANGLMHPYMLDAFAEALGLTPEDLQAQIDAGGSMWSIAQAQGLSDEDITALKVNARTAASAQMVADGVITQEQADWMNQRMTQMHAGGYDPVPGTDTIGV